MNNPEHNLQVACVNWFRMQYPKYGKLLFAIPNGGKRHAKTARDMKREGVQKGVPDLMLAVPSAPKRRDVVLSTFYSGLFVEMKSDKGRLTPDQSAYLEALAQQGYATAVCKSFDEFKATIENYLE